MQKSPNTSTTCPILARSWFGRFAGRTTRAMITWQVGLWTGWSEVDGLFGSIEGWIQHHLKRPGRRISSIDEMEQVLKTEAARATKMDPAVEYIVVRCEREQKPASAWVLPEREFQISKTYCLQLLPDNPNVHLRTTSIVDFTFTEMSREGRGWRRFGTVLGDAATCQTHGGTGNVRLEAKRMQL